jgi:hypothetical protein
MFYLLENFGDAESGADIFENHIFRKRKRPASPLSLPDATIFKNRSLIR